MIPLPRCYVRREPKQDTQNKRVQKTEERKTEKSHSVKCPLLGMPRRRRLLSRPFLPLLPPH